MSKREEKRVWPHERMRMVVTVLRGESESCVRCDASRTEAQRMVEETNVLTEPFVRFVGYAV